MLITKLLQHLSETVDACEEFCNNHLIYFHNGLSLRDIEMTFSELAALKKRLLSLDTRCKDFAREVSPISPTFFIHHQYDAVHQS